MRIETANLKPEVLHELIGNAITPLPLTLISTVGPKGVYNAAPFSFITPVCTKPPIICVSIGMKPGRQKKNTLTNIESTNDFVVNVINETMLKQAVQASADYPGGTDKIKEVGLTAVQSDKVKSPRIAESKVSLECRVVKQVELMDDMGSRAVVFAEVLVVHIEDEVWANNRIEPSRLQAVSRVGKDLYCLPENVFELKRP